MFIKINNIPENLNEFSSLLNIIKNKKLEDYKTGFDLELDYFKVFLYFISEYENIKENNDIFSNFHSFINVSISKFINHGNAIKNDDIFDILSGFDIFLSSHIIKGVGINELEDEIFDYLNENIELRKYFLK